MNRAANDERCIEATLVETKTEPFVPTEEWRASFEKQATRNILEYADFLVCVVFFGDFLFTLIRSENRWRYLRTWGWIDLLSSIPAVDVLRWGRAARMWLGMGWPSSWKNGAGSPRRSTRSGIN